MKKITCLFLALFVFCGCHHPSQRINIYGIQTINYEELTQNLNSDVTFILYIGRDDCGDCQTFYPLLENYIETHKGSGIFYLNVREMRDNARKEGATQQEKDFYDNIQKELDFNWTPTIHIYINGKVKKTYQYLDEDYYEIKDREVQIQKEKEFEKQFILFMNEYFKEEN